MTDTYDWADDFSKSWNLWVSTMRERHLQAQEGAGCGFARSALACADPLQELAGERELATVCNK